MSRILPIAILLGLGGAALYWFLWRDTELPDELIISGNIEMTEVDIAFKTPGKLDELLVEEGDAVRAGDVIARLDSEQLLRQRDRAVANSRQARSALEQTRAAIRFQRESVASSIVQRQAELRAARAGLNALEAGSRNQELERAKASVARAEAEALKARRDLERGRTLFEAEDISAQDFDRLVAQSAAAEAARDQAQQQYELTLEGPRKEDVESGRAQVERSRAALRTAEAGELDIARLEKDLAARAAGIEAAEAELAVIDSQLEDAVAVSPVDGVVLTKAAEEGEIVAAGTTIVTVADMERPWLRGYINQIYQGHVKVGSRVELTTDSFPGKVYEGTLSFLASEAEFTPKQIQTEEERVKLVYRVKIDVANRDQQLKLNMPADAVIPLAPSSGAERAGAAGSLP